jgi:hypothetical protein
MEICDRELILIRFPQSSDIGTPCGDYFGLHVWFTMAWDNRNKTDSPTTANQPA